MSCKEKVLLAEAQKRPYMPSSPNTAHGSKLRRFGQQMNFKKAKTSKVTTPWKKILSSGMLWVANLQGVGQAWGGQMMVLMVMKYLEEIHGYSLQESAIMVTIPNNIAQFILGFCSGSLNTFLTKRVSARTVRRLGAGIQILAILPLLLLPFLPCSLITNRATVVVIQVLGSFRVFGQLAGYSSYHDISPTFQGHLFGIGSIVANTLAGVIIPLMMGAVGTTKHSQWQLLFPINCGVVILSNLVYIALVSTEQASWEPAGRRREQGEVGEVAERLGRMGATERLAGARGEEGQEEEK